MKEDINKQLDVLKEDIHRDKNVEKINNLKKALENDESNNDLNDVDSLRKVSKRITFYQSFIDALSKELNFDPGRLMALTDGIFSIVMTLLIFGISIPETQINNYTSFLTFLSELAPVVCVTIVSFIILASFWVYHHEFINLKKFNFPFLWVNILFLLSVSFIPFTTSLIGNYSHFFLSEILFGINIFIVLIIFVVMYIYASSKGFLEGKNMEKEKDYTINTFKILMLLVIAVNLLDYFLSPNFIYLFLLIPIISTIRNIRYKMKKQSLNEE